MRTERVKASWLDAETHEYAANSSRKTEGEAEGEASAQLDSTPSRKERSRVATIR